MTVWMTLVAVALSASVAHADPGQFDDLMRPDSMAQPLDMRPRTDHQIDMLAAAEHRHDRLWRAIDTTTLLASTAALAIDGVTTYRAAAAGWHGGPACSGGVQYEANPIMGRTPSTGIVVSYFATTMALNAALWMALPRGYRSIIPLGIVGVQAHTIAGNIDHLHNCTM